MKAYDHKTIEEKWQKRWEADNVYKTEEDSKKRKQYVLDMFPYPSGEGLHVGHPKGYIATDIYSRFKRMNGFKVLHPMGWDAFGLPAENFAIKNKVHPRVAVEKNIKRFKEQLSLIGFNYDWEREINTTDPEYYKWTQWIFLKLFEKGLAYESNEPINWCPSCQTGLANEDLNSDGTCERCDTVVEKRPMRQWVLKITDYADRLLDDLETLAQWPDSIKEAQRNWIGRSQGAKINFGIKDSEYKINVFTTRPDTIFGATYMVLAPEHKLVQQLNGKIENRDEIDAYINTAVGKSEMDRTVERKEKTGVELKGIKAINPASKEEILVYIADYVLAHYGTGAIMAVPAHDERDFAFAKKFNLPVKPVILKPEKQSRSFVMGLSEKDLKALGIDIAEKTESGFFKIFIPTDKLEEYKALVREKMEPGFWNEFSTEQGFYFIFKHKNKQIEEMELTQETNDLIDKYGMIFKGKSENIPPKNVYSWLADNSFYKEILLHTESGTLINSGTFDGMDSEEAKGKITEFVGGEVASTYRIQDWVFSRQRYWGEPIPIIHCEKCGAVPVPEEELPVLLPEVEHYEPTGTGESPLASIKEWVNVTCPKCKGHAKRETNTMPQWAGSSWYWLRFMDPDNKEALVSTAREKEWGHVDVYVGGDHAVRHLIYARFWHKFLYDIGIVSTIEPFSRLEFLGFILAEDGRKMSKRWGNVINPDDVVRTNGADSFRTYEMFMGPFENTVPWSTNGLVGVRRFLEKVWRMAGNVCEQDVPRLELPLHQTIKKVTDDIEAFKFNTAVSQMMIFTNTVEKVGTIGTRQFESFLKVLSPFAPHMAEELWEQLGNTGSIQREVWPVYDESKLVEHSVTIAVQINGKVRGTVVVARDSTEEAVKAQVHHMTEIAKYLLDKSVEKEIYVVGRVFNIVIKN
ncbi:MAG TPA: leucine--tRNA ligase [Candidatus Paceibacterota bacterium]